MSSSSSTSSPSWTPGRLRVSGLWCTSCAHALERAFTRMDGVVEAHVSFAAMEAVVRFDPRKTSLASLAGRAEAVGYGARVVDDVADPDDDAVGAAINDTAVRLAAALVFGMWSMAGAWSILLVPGLSDAETLALARMAVAATIPVVLFSGLPFLRAGVRTTRVGAPGMDALVALGAVLSLVLSVVHVLRGEAVVYVDTATMLVTLLLAGRLIEHVARRRGARALANLLCAVPAGARRRGTDGVDADVLAKDVVVGDHVVVDAGAVVAVDGVVVEGVADVSAAVVTGEAVPVVVAPGAVVLAGSRVGQGSLVLRVTAGVGERRVDRLASRARELLVARDGAAALAERAARVLVPVVFVLAVLAGVVVLFTDGSVEAGLVRALTVVVVTCPCALGLATPAALLAATASARRAGVVFRDVRALESAARLRTVAFDKTGTLTTGALTIVAQRAHTALSVDDALALAVAVEGELEHPVAAALRRALGDRPRPTAHERVVLPGRGVRAVVDGRVVAVVTGAVDAADRADLAVDVLVDDVAVATFVFDDDVRVDAAAAVAALRAAGLRLVMLSGDRASRAHALGARLGFAPEDVHGGLTPEGKLQALTALRATGAVAFVGDGDNDAAALAAADVGVAVQGSTHAALEAAPVVLQQPGIASVARALGLARRTASVMRLNLAFAVVFNAVLIPAAMLGAVSPLAAAVAMGASSLIVTLHALRAR